MAKAPSLSIRQAEALALVARGWSFEDIASYLKIAPRVVLLYIIHLQRFLGARTPGELTQMLLEARLIPMRWARAQTRRRHPPKPRPATPPAVPASPPCGGPRANGPA